MASSQRGPYPTVHSLSRSKQPAESFLKMASDVNQYGSFSSVSIVYTYSGARPLRAIQALLFIVSLLASMQAQPSETDSKRAALSLPSMGNTAALDRLMLREIADSHIFDPAFLPPANEASCCPQGGSSGSEAQVSAASAKTVWQFVQQSRRLHIPDNAAIDNYRQQYQREALWISKILKRATPYVGHIVEQLDARYLPVELALLPAIESGYQADVHSAENAAGIWQIVPATANEMGVPSTPWYDGRADLIASTNAAIDYLSYLNAEFHGNWLLTLAAYNAGPGRVRTAIRRNRERGLSQDFWSLQLPRETREYVPKFLALVAMMRHDSPPDLNIPTLQRGNAFELLQFSHRTSLDRVAAVSGLPDTLLRGLNTGLVHGVTPPGGPHHVYVLKAHSEQVIQAVSRVQPTELYSLPANHTVVSGDSISTIAEYYGLSQPDLMAINELDSPLIKVGQKLAVRFNGDDWSSRIEYVVTIGDTLSDIAHRYSVTLEDIRTEQGESVSGDVIHPGEKLSILLSTENAG